MEINKLMKITIIQVGKTKKSFFSQAEDEYLKRLKPYAEVNVVTVKECPIEGAEGSLGGERDTARAAKFEAARGDVKRKEAAEILRKIPEGSFVVALDERGKQTDSVKFADFLREKRDFGGASVCFIVGGCYGLGEEVLKKAGLVLSFSGMTFTHEQIRVLLLEQVYRGFMILAGRQYHY